ncbi:DUF6497 family protein [Pseudosulfitobacter sp. DSM 107133]|uniref:DUF6497 family protein n=1 Tax=Pseudosulfitobacter sp. DSM 107133 TaxID=2883100 RepID=UPI001F07F707|nr:DUF6497 family protein [Pseudosulfitobacter sp. DSM 107133]UOA26370.1 hypothetical protein DSM107133_01070 [Pseudosulfitobacter sp. DSM 107133]
MNAKPHRSQKPLDRINRCVPLRAAVLTTLMATAAPLWAFDVPSGQVIDLQEVLIDDTSGTSILRFRFLAPEIARDGGTMSYVDSAPDIESLCANTVVPYIAEYALTPEVVVISLADRAVEFGQPDPDATQFFDAFRIENDTCIWEAF